MADQTVTIDIPAACWLTSNMRLHWTRRAKSAASIRNRAGFTTLAAIRMGQLTPMSVADVTVWVGYPSNRRQDPDNAAPSAKAAIDGVVDAGLLPDDDSEHRPSTTYRRDHPTGRPGWYRLRLEFNQPEGTGE